ncbi:hypothetical protein GY45DRAFT_240094 [Cubamyces sp. BRFM 1775]|nr:hypothetical protein GY45DRAFT_240094 [Cubamyces sp. BRFM 1775]
MWTACADLLSQWTHVKDKDLREREMASSVPASDYEPASRLESLECKALITHTTVIGAPILRCVPYCVTTSYHRIGLDRLVPRDIVCARRPPQAAVFAAYIRPRAILTRPFP